MDEVGRQVLACVAAVFPELAPSALPQLSQQTHAGWDSVAHVTLYAVLGEAFAVELDLEAFAQATSVPQVLAQVREQVARGPGR